MLSSETVCGSNSRSSPGVTGEELRSPEFFVSTGGPKLPPVALDLNRLSRATQNFPLNLFVAEDELNPARAGG